MISCEENSQKFTNFLISKLTRVIAILKYLNESFLLIFNSLSHFHFFQLKISQKLTKKREKMRQLLLLKYVQLCTIINFF